MEGYSVLKRNELSRPPKTQRGLTCTLPSERSQSEKATYWMSPNKDLLEAYGVSIQIAGCRGFGGSGGEGWGGEERGGEEG